MKLIKTWKDAGWKIVAMLVSSKFIAFLVACIFVVLKVISDSAWVAVVGFYVGANVAQKAVQSFGNSPIFGGEGKNTIAQPTEPSTNNTKKTTKSTKNTKEEVIPKTRK